MGYRKLENIKERIEQEALLIGATKGVAEISARNVAKACGISTHTIYCHFKSMKELIDTIAQRFDRKHMDSISGCLDNNMNIIEIFDFFVERFIEDKIETLYYISYNNKYGFDPTINNPRANEFLKVAHLLFSNNTKLSDDQTLLLWDYITSMAFFYAEKIIKGFLENTFENKENIHSIVFRGLNSILNAE